FTGHHNVDIYFVTFTGRCAAGFNSTTCYNGGVPNPRQCDVCLCPYGYGGKFCDQRPAGCGERLKASAHWKTKKFTFMNTSVANDQAHMMCNHWIEAPLGKWIEVRVIGVPSNLCYYGCCYGAIEPKVQMDKMVTNPRYCCEEQLNKTLVSKLNPTPVFSYSVFRKSVFTFQYRYK
ncbi:hypothetical protein COOONC_19900, partial [Cooperia oncophora]